MNEYKCEECGRPITKGQSDYSTVRFGRMLCPKHQLRLVPVSKGKEDERKRHG